MPIPELNENGLLPEGIHDCTLEEIGARFGRFQSSDRRVRLFEKLSQLLKETIVAKLAVDVIVDGSFVTDKPEPGDIDLVIVLPEVFDFSVELRPFEYNSISKSRLYRKYGFDVFVVSKHSFQYQESVKLFQDVKDFPRLRKGVLRINL